MTREQLEEAIESEDGFATGTHHHDHDSHKPKAAKKATKKPAEKAAAKATSSGAEKQVKASSDEPKPAAPVKKAATKAAPTAKAEPAAMSGAKKAPANKG